MDYETQQVRVALSGTPLLVMEEGGEEDFTPMIELGHMAARLYKDNILTAGWFLGLSILILVGVTFIFSLTSWVTGNQWLGLALALVVLLFVAAPIISLAKYRLALAIWDDGDASPLEAFKYAATNLGEASAIFWQSMIYEADLLARLIISIAPATLAGKAVYVVLNYNEVASAFSWSVFVAVAIGGLMVSGYIWPRARRQLTFLSPFCAFEKIDGQSGFWRLRFELMYYWLAKKRYASSLNLALLLSFPIIFMWTMLTALVVYLWLPPLITAYLVVLFPFSLRLAAILWYNILAAGYYRYNFIPEPI